MKAPSKAAVGSLVLFLSFPLLAAETPAWVAASNKNAQLLLESWALFNPESAAQVGVDGHDDRVIDLKPRLHERGQAENRRVLAEVQARLKKETDRLVRQDLEILIKATEDQIASNELHHELMLPYFTVSKTVFNGLRALFDPRLPPERRAKAVDRLRRYAGLEKGYEPVTKLARDRMSERFGKKLVGPYKVQVEQDLADTPRLVAGIKDLFAKSELKGYEEALAAIEKQLTEHDEWVRKEILPRAREDNRLPPEIYADNLKQFGVDIPPEELISKAMIAFAEIRNEMQAIALQIADKRDLGPTDYRDVIRELKKQQLYGEEILPFYKARMKDLEAIVKREGIATLPKRDAAIRLGTEAESAVAPAPHLSPPRLVGNTGEYAEFVLPLNVPGKDGKDLKMDDFTNKPASWSLAVHEARPGHEMQFAAMIENGVSTARAVFAFNSVNVEGWALYAEAIMKPYLPLGGQLFSLQARLQRAARAFLDPMVNLGRITPQQVQDFLMKEVVLSEALAKQEVDRYTYRAPGQATSYFYGYQRLMETRQMAELALRGRFDQKSFHDFVLAQGLLPPDLLRKAVMEDYVPSRN